MKSKTKLLGLIVISTVALMLYISGAHGQEDGVDRRGSDLKPGYNLPAADPALCKKDCDADPNCQAYTYVKPGFQGPQPRCWLKSAVPAAVKNDCCVSGVNWAMLTPTATPVGCIDPSKPPPGIVFGLKHSTNQRDKWLAWGGAAYDPATAEIPPAMFTRQNGGDLDGSEGEGYYWYETTGIGFRFQVHSPSNDEAENKRWRAFASQLPEGLVFGLKHSKNQPHKFLLWLDLPREFIPWQPGSYDPAQGWSDESKHFGPWPFVQENGGDIDGSKGEGYYWYEVSPDAVQTTRPCDALLPGGLVFGLKHSINQPNKKFTWHGEVYDAAQRGGPRPPGFARCHGGDLGAPAGEGFYWFETVGESSGLGAQWGLWPKSSNCEYDWSSAVAATPRQFDPWASAGTSRFGTSPPPPPPLSPPLPPADGVAGRQVGEACVPNNIDGPHCSPGASCVWQICRACIPHDAVCPHPASDICCSWTDLCVQDQYASTTSGRSIAKCDISGAGD